LATEADGVHLGLDDLPITAVRGIMKKRLIIGASVSSVHEARKVQREGADYLSVQSIFPTTSKDDVNVVGLERLKEIINVSKIPVIAIGGINLDNVNMVIGAGAMVLL